MKQYAKGLNDLFGLDGPDWIEITEDDFNPLPDTYTFNSEYQRQLASDHCKKLNENQKGSSNRNAKTWKVTYLDGRVEVIKALQSWAVDNGYSTSGVKILAYKLKPWKRYKDIKSIDVIVSNLQSVSIV